MLDHYKSLDYTLATLLYSGNMVTFAGTCNTYHLQSIILGNLSSFNNNECKGSSNGSKGQFGATDPQTSVDPR